MCRFTLKLVRDMIRTYSQYRLEACDFVGKCFAKISRRKFLDNLKVLPCRSHVNFCDGNLFNEIAGISSALATLV